MKGWILVGIVFVLIIIAAVVLVFAPAPQTATAPSAATSTPAELDDTIIVTSPLPNSTLSSTTITIAGEARGPWFFEAVAPVMIKDSSGTILARGQIRTTGDWTTSDYVAFEGTLMFTVQTPNSAGTLVFMNDNPSGNAANQKELDVPVIFK